jgi:hypothetical protein
MLVTIVRFIANPRVRPESLLQRYYSAVELCLLEKSMQNRVDAPVSRQGDLA